MKAMRTFLFVAFAYCVAHSCPLLAAEELKYPSPDGRFALRITQPKDDEYHPTAALIEKDPGKVMVGGLKVGGVWFSWQFAGRQGSLARGACLFLERLGFRQSVFAGEPAGAGDQVSQGKRRERETLWRRGEALEVVEVKGFWRSPARTCCSRKMMAKAIPACCSLRFPLTRSITRL
jgi:hypothetical protein